MSGTASIPLGITPPQTGFGSAGINPLQAIGALGELQQRANANRLFQATMAGRQRLGEIISQAPDLESGIAAATKDPTVAAYFPDGINSLRQTQNVLTQTQGLQAGQTRDAFQAVLRGMAGATADPNQFPALVNTQLALMPKEIRERVMPGIQGLQQSLLANLPKDPAQAAQEFQKRSLALVTGAGVPTEALQSFLGKPGEVNQGGQVQPTLQTLGQPPRPAGGAFPMFASPTVKDLPTPGGSMVPALVPDPRLAPAQPLGGGIRTPSSAEAENTKQASEEQKSQDEAAAELPTTNRRVTNMIGALQQFQAGGFADWRATGGKFAQGLREIGVPINKDVESKIANGSLTATDFFRSQVRPAMVSQLKNDSQGMGRVVKTEIDSYLKSVDENTDPGALLQVMNNLRAGLADKYQRTVMFREFQAKVAAGDPSVAGYNKAQFNSWYGDNFDPANLPTSNLSGKMPLGPAESIKGAGGAPKPTARYDPKTKKWEEIP